MTHRTQVKFLNIDDEIVSWENKMLKSKFSIYPVYKKNHDNVIGTIKFKDFFKEKHLKKEELIPKTPVTHYAMLRVPRGE